MQTVFDVLVRTDFVYKNYITAKASRSVNF